MQIVFSPYCRYFMHGSCADMRKGFDGLCGIVREGFKLSPLSGDVFIFLNRKRDVVKVLQWQTDGFAIFHKRLEKGTFEIPCVGVEQEQAIKITSRQLDHILCGIQLKSVKLRTRYEKRFVDNNM